MVFKPRAAARIGYFYADRAQAQHTQGLARHLKTRKMGLFFSIGH